MDSDGEEKDRHAAASGESLRGEGSAIDSDPQASDASARTDGVNADARRSEDSPSDGSGDVTGEIRRLRRRLHDRQPEDEDDDRRTSREDLRRRLQDLKAARRSDFASRELAAAEMKQYWDERKRQFADFKAKQAELAENKRAEIARRHDEKMRLLSELRKAADSSEIDEAHVMQLGALWPEVGWSGPDNAELLRRFSETFKIVDRKLREQGGGTAPPGSFLQRAARSSRKFTRKLFAASPRS